MEVKNVIFDVGKVLVHFDFNIFYERLGYKACERNLDEANEEILLFEAGKISKDDFFKDISRVYDIKLSQEEFEKLWVSVFFAKPDMTGLAKKVAEHFNIYIFSNTDELHFPYIWENFPDLHIFGENLMLSYELGAVKPELEAYFNGLNKFGLKPEECLFIDDRPINVQVAEDIGMRGLIHKSYEETKAKLETILGVEFGIKIQISD
jgi:putative hydrolase of the HAD superfamily